MQPGKERCGGLQIAPTHPLGIQRGAMMIFDEHDLHCWMMLLILTLLMAWPLR